jgi:hypothetical protein
VPGGVSNRTMCAMPTVLSSALTTAMKRGLVDRNVAQLVDRPAIEHREMSRWTPQQVERFREHVRRDRQYACWLLTRFDRHWAVQSSRDRPGVPTWLAHSWHNGGSPENPEWIAVYR